MRNKKNIGGNTYNEIKYTTKVNNLSGEVYMKIFTYKDPCNLWNTTDKIGEEIEGAPHFCVSEVLVQGLIAKWDRKKFKCIATIDEFMKNLFPSWLLDTSKDVERFLEISKIIDDALINSTSQQEQNIIKSFKKNIRGVLDAVKYLWETEEFEVNNKIINGQNIINYRVKDMIPVTPTEKVFINKIVKTILKERSANKSKKEYWYPEWEKNMSSSAISDAIRGCIIDEVRKEYKKETDTEEDGSLEQKRENALAWLRNELTNKARSSKKKRLLLKTIESHELSKNNKIVFHGIYRMRAIHFKMFEILEDMGYEVIILNCYNPDYSKIYQVWDELYCMLTEKFKVTEIRIGQYASQIEKNHIAGKIYGGLVEGYQDISIPIMDTNENQCEFYEYLTTMQFINAVSEVFDSALDENGERQIASMKEQFYGVNGIELNEIFKIFYSEIFRKKSFMSYPLGQFIYYIHDMWDSNKKELRLNHNGLIECLNMYNEEATAVYNKVAIYIGLEREKSGLLLSKVKEKIKKLEELSSAQSNNKEAFNRLVHFGYFIKSEKYEVLLKALEALDKIASSIFNVGSPTADKHYQRLVSMIATLNKQQGWRVLEKDESQLLKQIKSRLGNTKDDGNQRLADVSVLKQTIDFYLDGHSEKDEIKWLVRDFEQIDGDLLLFHADEPKKSKAATAHYALLSNENMLIGSKGGCVWPLTEEAVNNKWVAHMLKKIVENEQAYKRCMFFQGLFYLPKEVNVRLSYVKNVANLNNDEKNHDEYFFMKGMRKAFGAGECIKVSDAEGMKTSILAKTTHEIAAVNESNEVVRILSECPYKYMFSAAINEEPYVYNENNFLIIKFFEEYIEYCIKKNENDVRQLTKEEWKNASNRLLGDICTEKEIADIIERAFSNKSNGFIRLNLNIPKFWVKDVKEQKKPHKYPDGEPWKERVNKNNFNKTIKDFLEENWNGFIGKDGTEYAVSEYMCEYCSQKSICLYPYRMGAQHLIRKEKKQYK